MSRSIGIVLSISILSGCSSWFIGFSQPPDLPLLPPSDYFSAQTVFVSSDEQVAVQRSQRVIVEFQGQKQTLLAAWTVNQDELIFVGLTPTGQRLLTLSYDGKTLEEDFSPLMPDAFPARDVLAQVQLAHWPESSVQNGYRHSAWQARVSAGCRQLFLQRRLVLSVSLREAGGCQGLDNDSTVSEQDSEVFVQHHWVDFFLSVTSLDKK
ncbi:hypothetical protein NBRC116494_05290 [Aurantivibrio plasticivorans]